MSNAFSDKLTRLAPLGKEEKSALIKATANARLIDAKHDLIREGDRPGPVFVILKGWACRYKILPNGGRQILAYLLPGDCCDLHIALLAEMDHSIQTVTEAMVATIAREEMDEILDRYPAIARGMYISQLIDEGTMRSWIAGMGRRTSKERVGHLMCELYLKAVDHNVTTKPFALPLSQLMLADSLGMTPVHLNRVLKELRAAGAMTISRGNLIVENPQKLVNIAGFDENYLHRRMRRTL